MQASVPGEIQWRLEFYAKIFAFCQHGGFSLARFLALVPDRLRLAVGESVERIRVPVAITPELVSAIAAHLPGDHPIPAPLFRSPAELRRLLRLCQLDAELDPLTLGPWLTTHGTPFVEIVAQLYARGLREIGAGEGGEETAYLVHLQLIEAARQAQSASPALYGPKGAVLLAALVDLALRATLDSEAMALTQPSARLGFQLAATLSPFAFGVDAESVAARPLNAYRTNAAVFALARRVIQDPVEVIQLERVVDALFRRILADATLRSSLAADAAADLLRDCLMLLGAQEAARGGEDGIRALRGVFASGAGVRAAIEDRGRRAALLAALEPLSAAPPAAAAMKLLAAGDAILAGDTAALAAHGNLETRAKLAVTGAVVLALDERVEQARNELGRIFQPVPAADQARAYTEGRCYRLARDELPLYLTPKSKGEGHLFIDARDLTERLYRMDARSAGDLLKRYFYDPVFELWHRMRGPDGRSLRLSRLTEDSLAFRGDIVTLLELAIRILRIVAEADRSLEQGSPDVLGGRAEAEEEIIEERAALRKRAEEIDAALRKIRPQEAAAKFLRDEKALLDERLAQLVESEKRARLARAGDVLRAGAFIGWGEVGEEVPLGPSGATVVLSRALLEASSLVGRSARVERERARIAKYSEKLRTDQPIEIPYRVMVRRFPATESQEELTEVWNAGCALSGEALAQFQKERKGVLRFDDFEVATVDLDADFRRRYVLEGAAERFVLARRTHDDSPLVLFHRAGKAKLGARGAEREVEVWEAILAESEFALALFGLMESHG